MKRDTVIIFYPRPWPHEARGRIPYALLYLERMVRDLPVRVVLIDEQVMSAYQPIIQENRERLLVAGVSAMTGFQIKGGMEFSCLVKKHTDAPVIWGGWHATLLPEQTLADPSIDAVVVGQGEPAFRAIVERLLRGEDLANIPGVAFKQEGQMVITPPGAYVNINSFPRIDFSRLDPNDYVFGNPYSSRCVGYLASHGCPLDCGFCCIVNVFHRKCYQKRIAEIVEDLQTLKRMARIESVTFDDDNFFLNRSHIMEFCQALLNAKLDLLWDTSAHAGLFLKLFSDEDVELMHRSGCRQIYIGAESGDPEVMDFIDKKASVEDTYRFVDLLNRHRIAPLLSTMVCFPLDPDRDLAATLDMIRCAKLRDRRLRARVFFYTPYPGTRLYARALERGMVPPHNLGEWATHTLRKFHAPWWKRDYRRELECFVNFYFPLVNPGFYRIVPVKRLKPVVFLINMLFFPIARLRFRLNWFRWPVEALVFLFLLRLYNRLAGTQYALGYESYFES
jgi:radical SAM superfamily enzyme YgiQ (UPF0313 family)